MHLQQRVKEDLAKHPDHEHEYICAPKEFNEVETYLLEARAKYSFDSSRQRLRIQMPTFIHGGCGAWFTAWAHSLDLPESEFSIMMDTSLKTFRGEYHDSEKNPDGAIYPSDRKWPTIVLETGYSENYQKLLEDVDLLLRGSEGRIGVAILIKIDPLKQNETSIQSAFIEVFRYDKETIKIGRRKRLIPPPPNRANQKIELSWYQVLRNKTAEFSKSPEQKAPPLQLDQLRNILGTSVARHLAFKIEGQEDSEKE